MIKKETFIYSKKAFLSLFSENTGKHLENIEKEIKGIVRDSVVDYMKSERGQKTLFRLVNEFQEMNESEKTDNSDSSEDKHGCKKINID